MVANGIETNTDTKQVVKKNEYVFGMLLGASFAIIFPIAILVTIDFTVSSVSTFLFFKTHWWDVLLVWLSTGVLALIILSRLTKNKNRG